MAIPVAGASPRGRRERPIDLRSGTCGPKRKRPRTVGDRTHWLNWKRQRLRAAGRRVRRWRRILHDVVDELHANANTLKLQRPSVDKIHMEERQESNPSCRDTVQHAQPSVEDAGVALSRATPAAPRGCCDFGRSTGIFRAEPSLRLLRGCTRRRRRTQLHEQLCAARAGLGRCLAVEEAFLSRVLLGILALHLASVLKIRLVAGQGDNDARLGLPLQLADPALCLLE